jgi:hypothetical protein
MALSIFSFEKRRVRNSGSGKISRSEQSSVAVLDAPEEEHSSSTMLLDLEHLTPEVMDAFFPSESTLPTPAPRNPAKRRGAFSR